MNGIISCISIVKKLGQQEINKLIVVVYNLAEVAMKLTQTLHVVGSTGGLLAGTTFVQGTPETDTNSC